ncbi:MAG TPA: response regulator [Candidatus Ornithomonoglobus intestinigallinarum]|uniref:Stage 0 sporulation protein A homolog n=1 Tax=Candidatus Ornithomonoglobus intestinigallinarum TaxID=2840894 RepID=A0A9D1H689_9FIRM|nr:response regulator [Candidatus Ornithomonoglobus intestinigallinarum]
MFKVIVVDDEAMIRSGISSFVEKSELGFEVVKTFPDGAEAISYLENHDIDLVITDIRMVNVSGIELAHYVYKNKPRTKVILLSGYAEFEYARAAIKYNVSEYITKPTNFTDLRASLMRIREQLAVHKRTDINAFLDNIKQLYADILSGSMDDASATFKLLLDSNNHGNEYLGQYACNLFEIINDHLAANMNIKVRSDKLDYKKLPELSTYDEIYDFSLALLGNIVNQIALKDEKPSDIVAAKLIQFINEHFSENISLQDASERVFFNPAYCSRFFKKQTGENFSDYLLRVRMEHAVKLLKENKKITDISRECGYSSSGYFSRIFKDYYGCTPSDYIRNL